MVMARVPESFDFNIKQQKEAVDKYVYSLTHEENKENYSQIITMGKEILCLLGSNKELLIEYETLISKVNTSLIFAAYEKGLNDNKQ